jgi:hypothetical protein
VGEVQASDGGDRQAAELGPAVAAVAGVVGDGDVAPGQCLELVVQRGLVAFDDEQVGGVLLGDQPVGVFALGVDGALCRGRDNASAVTTTPVRSRPSSSGRNPVIWGEMR